MKIKLEIISGELTPKQKGAIVEKLEEIRAIVNEGSVISEPKSRGEKTSEYFRTLRYGAKNIRVIPKVGISLEEYLALTTQH